MLKKREVLLIVLFVLIALLSACSNENKDISKVQNQKNGQQQEIKQIGDLSTKSTSNQDEPAESNSSESNKAVNNVNASYSVDDYKKETLSFHAATLTYIAVNRNSGIPELVFSENYVNLITGEKKQGLNQKYFEDFYKNSDIYNKIYKAKSVSELVNFNKSETFSYDYIMKTPEKCFVSNKANFKYQQGDVLVIIPPSKGSPLKDGWIGVYRKENGERKMVAGSF